MPHDKILRKKTLLRVNKKMCEYISVTEMCQITGLE